MAKSKSKRPTPEEKQERVEMARQLIGQGLYRSEIKRQLSDEYGITTRSAERHITDAIKSIRESVERSDADQIGDAIAFYEQIIRDKNASHVAKIKARERMDKILGIEVTRHAISMNYKEKLEELGVDPETAMSDMREAIASALQNTTKSPGRRN